MSRYRDDRDTLEARLAQVEGELASAQATIDRLRGTQGPAPTDEPEDPGVSKITGAPKRTHLRRRLPFAVSEQGYEAVLAAYHQHLPHTQAVTAAQVGGSLTIKGVDGTLTLRRVDEHASELTVESSHAGIATLQAALSLFPLTLLAPIMMQLGAPPEMFVVAAPFVSAGILLALRPAGKRLALKHRRKLAGLFEAACDVASLHQRRVRVDGGAGVREGAQQRHAPGAEQHAAEHAEEVGAESPSAPGPQATHQRG